MMSQRIRFFLIIALALVGFLLYNHWQVEHPAKTTMMTADNAAEIAKKKTEEEIPEITMSANKKPAEASKNAGIPDQTVTTTGIKVSTDVLELTIDPNGGDIVELGLPAYVESKEHTNKHFILFDQSPTRYYIAQSGLAGEGGPDIRGVGRAKYEFAKSSYQMNDNEDRLVVDLSAKTKDGVEITKRFVFLRGSYVINVEYLIANQSNHDFKANFYARLKRKPGEEKSSGFFGMGVQTFTGAAINTKETPYKKFTFKEMGEKPFTKEVENGWAAMVEQYFVSAWIPAPGITYSYQTQHLNDGSYAVGLVAPTTVVPPKGEDSIQVKLYAGPEITDRLEQIAPGLELTADYGILWPICQPIFWLLKLIHSFVNNWGWSIVIITIIIKLLFYKLSATSYKSMGRMRKLQPKIEALKQRHGEDKQKFSQSVMELYKKEKINPLGGCLPILIQIPVFIALYYVLLGSVELRQAPFILWITDLSSKDPYYVLPVLMGLSMFFQQKLNPAPPDPIQAKVMMFMPIIFTVMFLNFPSGLVLYWLVNNLLSILQQWVITRRIEAVPAHGAK